jgi:hypothetical protein
MEEVSFLFVLLRLIAVRELVDIVLYPINIYGKNTNENNLNKLRGSILLFALFFGVQNDFFLNVKSNVVPNDRMIMNIEFGKVSKW